MGITQIRPVPPEPICSSWIFILIHLLKYLQTTFGHDWISWNARKSLCVPGDTAMTLCTYNKPNTNLFYLCRMLFICLGCTALVNTNLKQAINQHMIHRDTCRQSMACLRHNTAIRLYAYTFLSQKCARWSHKSTSHNITMGKLHHIT